MNVLYNLCLTEAGKRDESKRSSLGWSKPLHDRKTHTKAYERTAETRKRTVSGFKPLPVVNIGTNINEEDEEEEEEEDEETEERVQDWSKPLDVLKTYTKTTEKTQVTKKRSFTCSKPLPIVKTDTTEDAPGESPIATVKTPDLTSKCC